MTRKETREVLRAQVFQWIRTCPVTSYAQLLATTPLDHPDSFHAIVLPEAAACCRYIRNCRTG